MAKAKPSIIKLEAQRQHTCSVVLNHHKVAVHESKNMINLGIVNKIHWASKLGIPTSYKVITQTS